jgi:hypothetical protein
MKRKDEMRKARRNDFSPQNSLNSTRPAWKLVLLAWRKSELSSGLRLEVNY